MNKNELNELSYKLATEPWCQPNTSNTEMDVDLAENFRSIIIRLLTENEELKKKLSKK